MPSSRQSSGHQKDRGRPRGRLVNGELIRERREALGLSNKKLAERADVNPRTITRAEQTGGRLGEASIRDLAKALSVSPADIILVPTQEVHKRLRQLGLAAPAPPAPWVERPTELDWVRARVGGASARICCLAGPSGIGKTALARFAVDVLAERYPHGVVWVTASRAGKPVDIIEVQRRIAEALDLEALPPAEQVGEDLFTEAFADELWAQERLLVLDDVVDASVLDRFGARRPEARILATTHLLHVAERFGEDALPLGRMGVDDTRRILCDLLDEARVREDEDGVGRLHEALAGIPRNIHIACEILKRERLVSLGEYAGRVLHDPAAGEFPEALRSPATSLMASFAQVQPHVTPGAWALLGALSLFDEVPFSLAWAAAAAGTSSADIRAHLSELIDLYLVAEEPAGPAPVPAGAAPAAAVPAADIRRFRLDSHVPLFARGVLGPLRGAALERLAQHAVALARRMREQDTWDELHRDQVLWSQVLDGLLASVLDMDAVRAWDGVQPVPGQVEPGGVAAALAAIALDLVPRLERTPVHDGGTWLRGGAACALGLGRRGDAGRLLLGLGRWWLRTQVDLNQPIAWFDAAADLLVQAGEHALASAAVSEAGRALFGCQRPAEGLERFERAIAHAREAFDTGTELACRLSSAAASFTRQPGLDGWLRAAELLEQAVAACTGMERDGLLMRVVCACNLAVVRFVLGRAGRETGAHEAPADTLAGAFAAWQTLDLEAPIFAARLLSLRAVVAAGVDDAEAARLRAGTVALWRARLLEAEPATEGFLWQLGEAAFYLRLYLAFCADAGQGLSPVIAQGFALSDISRELPLSSGDLVPMAFLFPVPPLLDVFSAEFIAGAREEVEVMYGTDNRILDELRGIEELHAAAGTQGVPWQWQ